MKKSLIFRLLALMVAALWACQGLRGAHFMPPLTNYGLDDYPGGFQNWGAAQAPGGTMVFANREGLLSYDGYRWHLERLPHSFHVRSLCVAGDRVYVGSYEDFGYFSRNPEGGLTYTSLAARLPAGFDMDNCDISSIVALGEQVWFQGTRAWFCYADGKVTAFSRHGVHPTGFMKADGRLYAQLAGGDLCELLPDGNFRRVVGREEIGDDNVSAIIPFVGGEVLLVSRNHGLWRYRPASGHLEPFVTDADGELRTRRLISGLRLSDGTIGVGTLNDGAYFFHPSGHLLHRYDQDTGLNHNTVFSLTEDDEGNVWAGLDVGIAQIRWSSPVEVLRPERTVPPIGMVYEMLYHEGLYYIGTSQGLFVYSPATGRFELQEGTEGQCNFVREAFGDVWVGTARSLLRGRRDHWQVVAPVGAVSVIMYREELFVTTYTSPMMVTRANEVFPLGGISAPLLYPVHATDGSIWVEHLYDGALRLTLSDDQRSIRAVRHYRHMTSTDVEATPDGATHSERGPIHTFWLMGSVVMADHSHYFSYNSASKTVEPYPPLDQVDTADYGIHRALWMGDDVTVLSCNNSYLVVRADADGNLRIRDRLPVGCFDSPGMGAFTQVRPEEPGRVLLNFNNGLGRYAVTDTARTVRTPSLPRRELRRLSIAVTMPDGSEQTYPLDQEAEIPADYSKVTIDVLYPHFSHTPLRYRYTLTGGGEHRLSEGEIPSITYGQLSRGRHTLRVEAFTDLGERVGDTEVTFRVLQPWHASWWALCVYLLLLAGVLYAFSRWRVQRSLALRRIQYEQEQQRAALLLSEKDRMIALQKQELLQQQLESKSKEVATASMGLLAKNRSLDALRSRVQDCIDKGLYSRRSLESLLKAIDDDASADTFWKLYQDNFDIVHDDFFTTLRQRYPSLTSSDLRFCALLRLNLTTKDIAQMTNLTIRGVEAARYRLRRKLTDLPEGASLVDFLISLK